MAALQVPAQAARERLFKKTQVPNSKVKDEKKLITLIISLVEHLF